jgi:DMSO/TMAO reductase YedYZ molybdopterin-dependent catalytic subunit
MNMTSAPETETPHLEPERPGLSGALGVGVALGITELAAGLFSNVPSAISAVGSVVVDRSPGWLKDVSISLLGTADKGALAIGTVVVALLVGVLVGRRWRRARWLLPAAFGVFALAGIAAARGEPGANQILTSVVILAAAAAGYALVRRLTTPTVDDPTDGLAVDASRRRLMAASTLAGVGAIAAGGIGRSLIIGKSERARTTRSLPAAAVTVEPPSAAASLMAPELTPIVVPNRDFYRIDTALIVPRVDPVSWRMKISGLVDNPYSLSFDDLLNMPLVEQYVTIACVSNEVGGGLVGNAKWTGVPLADLLDRAGVRPGADQIVGRSVDGWTSGFPTELAFDGREPLVAVGMNDELLPARHGFPARLIVPGLYGYVSATKWLEEIELTTWDGFDSYWVPRGWSKNGPIKTQSRIDHPKWGEKVPGDPLVVAGVAWAPTKGVAGVEVRLDEGEWVPAELSSPLSNAAWVQWRVELPAASGGHGVEVRATDTSGRPQTATRTPARPNGATGHHLVRFGVL